MRPSSADTMPHIGTITHEQWKQQQELESAPQQESALGRVALLTNQPNGKTESLANREISFAGAPCRRGNNMDLFFTPSDGYETSDQKRQREESAKALCNKECDYRASCLQLAISISVAPIGIWGGKNEKEIVKLRRLDRTKQ